MRPLVMELVEKEGGGGGGHGIDVPFEAVGHHLQ